MSTSTIEPGESTMKREKPRDRGRGPVSRDLSQHARTGSEIDREIVDPVLSIEDVSIHYGSFRAIKDISLQIPRNEIVALIGPSGCGKSTLLRSLNRMHDVVAGARVEGRVVYDGENIYDADIDPVAVRRRIGMVFQKPNPFPKSIYENITFGLEVNGIKDNLDEHVERALRDAALWDEVKDKLHQDASALSGGQQQRLCIARTIAVRPDVILMDEPCSAIDPIATLKIEDLMRDLKQDYTILIVTHNMQQAARVSDRTGFLTLADPAETDERTGILVEYDTTERIFTQAADQRTEDYITGRFG